MTMLKPLHQDLEVLAEKVDRVEYLIRSSYLDLMESGGIHTFDLLAEAYKIINGRDLHEEMG